MRSSALSISLNEREFRATQSANAELVRMYWNIGAELNAHAEWGNKYIDSLSRDIRTAFPQIKGFSARSLKYMVKFNREVGIELCSNCCTIPWGHVMLLLDKTEPGERLEWYVEQTIENGWSRAVLDHQIDLKLYERQVLSGKVSNFTRTLPAPDSELAPAGAQRSLTSSTSSPLNKASRNTTSKSRWLPT